MSPGSAEERERIAFLLRVTRKEAEHLAQTDTLLFAQGAMDAGRAASRWAAEWSRIIEGSSSS